MYGRLSDEPENNILIRRTEMYPAVFVYVKKKTNKQTKKRILTLSSTAQFPQSPAAMKL